MPWPLNRVFSHDVTAAIFVSQNNETAAMLVSYANAFFCDNKCAYVLARWPCFVTNLPAFHVQIVLFSCYQACEHHHLLNKIRSPPTSLLFKGQGKEHTTVKWSIFMSQPHVCHTKPLSRTQNLTESRGRRYWRNKHAYFRCRTESPRDSEFLVLGMIERFSWVWNFAFWDFLRGKNLAKIFLGS